jgi:hypothetical protein
VGSGNRLQPSWGQKSPVTAPHTARERLLVRDEKLETSIQSEANVGKQSRRRKIVYALGFAPVGRQSATTGH